MLPLNLYWFLMHVILTVCLKNWVRFHNSCYKFSSKSAPGMQQKRLAKLKDPISLWLILELKIKRLALVLHTICLLVYTGILKTSLAGSGLMVRGQPLPTGILENLIIPEEGRRVSSCILRGTDWNGMTSAVMVYFVTFAKPVVSQTYHGLRTHFD